MGSEFSTPQGVLWAYVPGEQRQGDVLVLDRLARGLADEVKRAQPGRAERVRAELRVPRMSRQQIAKALARRWPGLARSLAKPDVSAGDLLEITDALQGALAARHADEERDLVVLAAHAWVEAVMEPGAASREELEEVARALGPFGADFDWREDESLAYCGGLLDGLLAAPHEDRWTDQGLLALLERGGETGCDCDSASQHVDAVLTRGEAFLARHPRSNVRAAIELALARAHETAWSMSKAVVPEEGDACFDPLLLFLVAPAHRDTAIQLYRHVLGSAPAAWDRPALERHLRRLELDIDSGWRVYSCECD
jgi:hypothetical protein